MVSVPSMIEGEDDLVASRLEIEQMVLAKLEREKVVYSICSASFLCVF